MIGNDQHGQHQPSRLTDSQSVSLPAPSPLSSTPTARLSRSDRSPTAQPLCQRQCGRVRRRCRTELAARERRGALGTATDGRVSTTRSIPAFCGHYFRVLLVQAYFPMKPTWVATLFLASTLEL